MLQYGHLFKTEDRILYSPEVPLHPVNSLVTKEFPEKITIWCAEHGLSKHSRVGVLQNPFIYTGDYSSFSLQ